MAGALQGHLSDGIGASVGSLATMALSQGIKAGIAMQDDLRWSVLEEKAKEGTLSEIEAAEFEMRAKTRRYDSLVEKAASGQRFNEEDMEFMQSYHQTKSAAIISGVEVVSGGGDGDKPKRRHRVVDAFESNELIIDHFTHPHPHASHPQTVVMSEDGEILIVDLDPNLKSAATSMETPALTAHPERGVVDPRVLAAEYEALSLHAKRAQTEVQDVLIAHGILDEAGMVKFGAEFGFVAMGEPEARTGLVADADRAIAAKLALGGEYVRDAAVFLGELAKDYPKIAGTIEGALIVWSWVDPISWALWAFDESGAKELSQGSLRDMFHKMGLHESAAGLSAVCIGMAEVYASKGKSLKSGVAAETKAGLHEVLDVIKMKSETGFRSISGKFHETPVTWTAPVGTGQTYDVIKRTDIDWGMIRTSGRKEFRGKTNLEAARAGVAPQLPDGYIATLHHIGQDVRGPLVEASTRYHGVNRGAVHHITHSSYGRSKPHPIHPVNHEIFSKETASYWKERVKTDLSKMGEK